LLCSYRNKGVLKAQTRTTGKARNENTEFKETLWLSRKTYEYAKDILGPKEVFYIAHEGVTFTASEGAWLVEGEPKPVKCPPGVEGECAIVQTVLGRRLGLKPFIIEKGFIFKGFKGEDISYGQIRSYRYFIAAYRVVDGGVRPLTEHELKNTLLWKNYLSLENVIKKLSGVSKFFNRKPWHLERFRSEALSKYKVVWRDVAKEFIPAIVDDGTIPDYTVNYVVTSSLEESCYLLAVLLAPQINAVVRELSPWIGHVQPRFIRYFKIPRYNPYNSVHRKLAEIGKQIHSNKRVAQDMISEIEKLVEKL